MSDVLVDKLRGFVAGAGGWAADRRGAMELETDGVVHCLMEAEVCKTEYAALQIAGFVGSDVGWALVTGNGKFTKRARASLDRWVYEYADGNGDTGSQQFKQFRELLARYVGSVPSGGWSRAYAVVDSDLAMRYGGYWSLHNHCWFREYKSSWRHVNAVRGLVIKGMWVDGDGCTAQTVEGQHWVDVGHWGSGTERHTPYWAGLRYTGQSNDVHGVRVIAVPLAGGGVWCFNFYRKRVTSDWDNGLVHRSGYMDRSMDGGLEVMRRDLVALAGRDYVARAVSGTGRGAYVNAHGGFVVVPRRSMDWHDGVYLDGIRNVCGVLDDDGAVLGVDDVRCLDYNAKLTRDGLRLIHARSCDECGRYDCNGCREDYSDGEGQDD